MDGRDADQIVGAAAGVLHLGRQLHIRVAGRVEIVDVDEDIGTDDASAASAADEVEDGATTASGAVDLDIGVADLDFGELRLVRLFERADFGEVDEDGSDRSCSLILLLL